MQRGVKKQLEQWSRALIGHIMSHDWEGIERTGESESEIFKKHQAGLNKGWRHFYSRQFDVLIDETLVLDIFKSTIEGEWNLKQNENVKSRKLTEEECQKAYVDITKKIPVIFLKKV